MFITEHDFYNLNQDFNALYSAAMDLDDRSLLKQLITISNNLDGSKIDHYAKIAQNIAIKQNRWDVEETLRFLGLVY